ncbi:MAG TPA: PAS domain S-box protein, partial [Caulobacteraceae bacterium]|nr:PAS domain S-box protein [Caulobacteraceae bacterium]
MPGVQIERRTTVRRRGEQESLESGRLAEMAGALAGVGYWRFDLATGKTSWSEMMFEIYGRSPDDPAPDLEEVLSTYHAECRDEIDQQIREAMARNPESGGYSVEFDLRRADGAIRRVLGQGALEYDPDGRPVAMFGTTVDVTEQRQAEKAVRESEALYRLLAENATDMIGRIDLDGVTLYVTPSIEKLMGYPAAEMIGRKTLEFVHRDDGAALVAGYRRVMMGGPSERIEYRFRHRDGHWVWVEACPVLVRDEHGQPKEFIDVARDITGRKALEQDLLEARRAAEAAAEAKAQFLANMSH